MPEEKSPYKGSTWDAFLYFVSGFKQLMNAPRLAIPSLISNALSSAFIWCILTVLILLSLPLVFEIAPVLRDYQDIFSDAYTESFPGIYPDLIKRFSAMGPEIVILSAISLILISALYLLFLVLYAYVGGGSIGYLWGGITDGITFKNFLYYGRNCVWRILGIRILLFLLFLIYSIIFFGAVALIISALLPGHSSLYSLVILFLVIFSFILWLFLWILISLPFFFVETSIVIENRGIMDSIRRSADLVIKNIWQILLFIVVSAVIWLVYSLLVISLEIPLSLFSLGISPLSALIILFFMNPWMDLARLNFFLNITYNPVKIRDVRIELIKGYLSRSKSFVLSSPSILMDFVRGNMNYILLSALFAGTGFSIGYLIMSQFSFLSGYITDILVEDWGEGLFGTPYTSLPFIDVFYYFFHNTNVIITLSLSGMFFVLPPLLGVSITAGTIGMVYAILPFHLATAAVFAHGIFELAALLIATAAGLRFGVHVIRRDPNIDRILDDTLKVGFASLLLIAIAAFIEAFITPVIIYMMV